MNKFVKIHEKIMTYFIPKETIVVKDKEHLQQLIQQECKKYGNNCDLNHLDVSQINDMSELFKNSQFNGNISK